MAKTMKKVISVLLALVLVTGTFAGCGKSNKEDTAAITATAVKFSKSGHYTTTVSSKKVDLSGITADNVEVRYFDLTATPEAESTEAATEEATTEAATEATEEIKLEEAYPLSAKVDSVKAADKKSYEITFTDDKAAKLITGSYIVLFKGVEGDDNTADIAVEFPEITLTPDVENVVSDATQAKVTLAIDGSTFEDDISEKDIYLDNAFSDMKVESVSSSDKNLTVQLKGSPVRNEAGAYQWGAIKVKPSGIKDGYADVTSKIDIQLATVNIDNSTLKFENGKINADLKVYGVVDINSLTKDNIKIDGAVVEAAEKADDNTVKLILAADGVKSVNDFADLFGGKAMTLGDYETTVSVSQASFYPVFDYVEADGDNLKLTLKLYANGGTFDKNIKADAISFADDFKDAKADSVKVDSDTVATLILSVPANGQTTENFKMNGTVKLAAGALTNAWGDKTSAEVSNTRDYSGETLGKEVTLNADTLLEIQKYTRGKNTLFGQICYWGGVSGQVYSIGKSVLEVAGVIKSEQQQIMDEFAAINTKLDGIHNDLISIRNDLTELKNNDYRIMLQNYQNDFDTFDKKLRDMLSVYAQAAEDITEEYPEYKGVKVEKLSDEEIAVYNERLMKLIAARATDISDADYCDFQDDFKEFKTKFENVTAKLASKSDENPLRLLDESCALTYNFDSQCYEFRSAQREYAKAQLTKALAVFAVRYNANKDPNNRNFSNMVEDYRAAINMIDELSYVGSPAKDIETVLQKEKVSSFISEVLIVGSRHRTDWQTYVKSAVEKGYKTYDDLKGNSTTRETPIYGYWSSFGYKTTSNYKNAVKDIIILKDTSDETVEIDGLTYHLAPYTGDDYFTASKGDFNGYSSSGTHFRVYYTTDDLGDGKAVAANITVNATSGEGIAANNLNEGLVMYRNPTGAPAPKRYIHLNRHGVSNPFSYVLGQRISLNNTEALSNYDSFGGAIKNGSSYRNWSENEYNEFTRRMKCATIKEEFKSAGLEINAALLLTYGWEKKSGHYSQYQNYTYWQYRGDVIKTNAKSRTRVDLGQSYIAKYDGKLPKTKSMDVTYIEMIK